MPRRFRYKRNRSLYILEQLAEVEPESIPALEELRHHNPQAYRKALFRAAEKHGLVNPYRRPGREVAIEPRPAEDLVPQPEPTPAEDTPKKKPATRKKKSA